MGLHQQWVLTEDGLLASKLPPMGISSFSVTPSKKGVSQGSALEAEAGGVVGGGGEEATPGDINGFVLGMPSTYERIFPSAGVEMVLVPRDSPRAIRWEVAFSPGAEDG